MREKKFRAWDKERKMFVPEGEITFFFYGDTRLEVWPNCLEYIGDSVHSGEPQGSRFEVVEYTGLKDRNKKEIYEGDIVVWNDGSIMKPAIRKAVVKIDPDIYFELTNDTPTGVPTKQFHYARFAYAETEKYLTVIGNIFESPELLNP